MNLKPATTLIMVFIITANAVGMRSEFTIHMDKYMAPVVDRLKAATPAPLREIPLDGQDIDYLDQFDSSSVIAGIINIGGGEFFDHLYGNFAPMFGPLLLIDKQSGKIVTSVTREANCSLPYALIKKGRTALLLHGDTSSKKIDFLSVDTKKGSVVWKQSFDRKTGYECTDNRLLTLEPLATPKLSCFSLENHQCLWTKNVQTGRAAPHIIYDAIGDIVYMVTYKIDAISVGDGSLKWTASFGGQDRSPRILSRFPNLLVGEGTTLYSYDRNGLMLWSINCSAPIEAAYQTKNEVLALSYAQSEARNGALVTCISTEEHSVKWTKSIQHMNSLPYTTENRIAYSTPDSLVVLNLSDGAPVCCVSIARMENKLNTPAGMQEDFIALQGDTAILANEYEACAWQVQQARPLFSIAFNGAAKYTVSRAACGIAECQSYYQSLLYRSSNNSYYNWSPAIYSPERSSVDSLMAVKNATTRNIVGSIMTQQRNYYESAENARMAASQNLENKLLSSTSTMSEKQAAANSFQISSSFTQIAASVQFAVSGIASSIQIGQSMAVAALKLTINNMTNRHSLHLSSILQAYKRTLQGRYIVRPVSNGNVDGYVIIDMNSCSWAEVASSPSDGGLGERIFADCNQGIITDDGYFITKGISFDRNTWRLQNRWNISTVAPCLKVFRLSDLQWHPVSEYAAKSIFNANGQ